MNGIELLNKDSYEDNYIFVGNNHLANIAVKKVLGNDYRNMSKLPDTILFTKPILVSGGDELKTKKFKELKRNYKYVLKFDSADMRKSLFRTAPNTNLVNFNDIPDKFLIEQIKKKLSISKSKAEKLLKYCSGNVDKIFNELQKLKYLNKKQINDYVSQLVVNDDKDIFKFLNNLFEGKQYIDILDRLPDNELKILYMLQKQLKSMIICKSLMKKKNKDIANNYNLHPYQVRLYKQMSSRYEIDTLKELFYKCNKIDRDIKTGRVDSLVGIDKLILEIYKTSLKRRAS